MDPLSFASIVSAGANILGGILGRSSNEDQMAKNRQMQMDFAQHGIQWKVEDAKAAGIHPMAALGASTMSPAIQTMQDPLGSGVAAAGQDISRAVAAGASAEQKEVAKVLAAQTVERNSLQNDLLRSQIRRMDAQTGPGIPLPGSQNNIPTSDAVRSRGPGAGKGDGPDPSAPYQESRVVPDVGWSRTPSGGFSMIPSEQVNQNTQDMGIEPMLWSWRNRVGPYLNGGGRVPPNFAPPGVHKDYGYWLFNHRDQVWYPAEDSATTYVRRNYPK